MKNLFVIIMLLALVGCMEGNYKHYRPYGGNQGNGHLIEHEPNPKAFGWVLIDYKDHDFLYNVETVRLRNRMLGESNRRSVPAGGYIYIRMYRSTIAAANPKWFEYVIMDGTSEIYRRKGTSSIANYTSTGTWWSSHLVQVPLTTSDKLTLYVIDNLQGGRDKFTIGFTVGVNPAH